MRIGVADYGLNQWYGGCFDLNERLDALRRIGYDGLERLEAANPTDVLDRSLRFRQHSMDFTTCRGPTPEHSIRWTAALGKKYVWAHATATDFAGYCRQVNHQADMAAIYGIQVGVHNHLGQVVESQAQLEDFLRACPTCGIVFDTGHLAAAGGDCLEIIAKYCKRILVIHVKDWLITNPAIGLDEWHKRGRFTGLGQGNVGQDNAAVVRAALTSGYQGWVFVEHDTHLQDPLIDLAASRAYLRTAGV